MNFEILWGVVAGVMLYCNFSLQAKLWRKQRQTQGVSPATIMSVAHQMPTEYRWLRRWAWLAHALLGISVLFAIGAQYVFFTFFYALCQVGYYQRNRTAAVLLNAVIERNLK